MSESKTLSLAKQLVGRASITPDDGGCQDLIAAQLQHLGFQLEPMRFGTVDNLWARRGSASPLFVFAGHTDVVPTGPEQQWRYPPFAATVADGYLHGRGAADMKGSIAAMLHATEQFVTHFPQHRGSIGFLITSDEEGPAIEGTVKVVETLQRRGEAIDWCLVGEPTSQHKVADTIKNGRRGSLSGHLVVRGTQGHVAYPHLADNPIHRSAAALAQLGNMQWDQGNAHFPPTTFQISNIHAGTGASNVIPGELDVQFNFRYSTAVTEQALRKRVTAILAQHQLSYDLDWTLSGLPYLTPPGELVEASRKAITDICGYTPELSTSGGTSDGRFIAPTGAQVIELGPINATIHKIDEHVAIDDLDILTRVYQRILQTLLA